MALAPIVLFVYNRPWHTDQTVDALRKNLLAKESELIVYSDAPKTERNRTQVELVRKGILNIDGFKKVSLIARPRNLGLAQSIIDGVSTVLEKYGKAIVLEDDLITSPFFLSYMNSALDTYENNPRIMSISAYNHPANIFKFPENYDQDVWLSLRNSSWGWGTWFDRWRKVDWDVSDYAAFQKDPNAQANFNRGGEDLSPMLRDQMEGRINSWAIRFSYAHFKNNAYSVCPRYSYVMNIGFDGTGTHCGKSLEYQGTDLTLAKENPVLPIFLEPNNAVLDSFKRVYYRGNFLHRIANKISRKFLGKKLFR